MSRWLLLSWGLAAGVLAAPAGHLAYVAEGQGFVTEFGSAGRTALPQSAGISSLVLVPTTGEAFYHSDSGAWRSAVPYTSATPWQGIPSPSEPILATADGRSIYLADEDGGGRFDVVSGSYTPLPYQPQTATADGTWIGYQTEKTLELINPASGQIRKIFSIGQPEAYFAALRKAKAPEKLKELTDAIDPATYRDQYAWGFGPVALTPDGQRAFFAANAGTTLGASGNTVWSLMVHEAATNTLQPLSLTGVFYGRLPEFMQVSPDGQRLLMLTSLHDNAAVNPRQATVIDLLTQQSRELLWSDARIKAIPDITNLASGITWSPDGRYVAVAAVYYDGAAALADGTFEFPDSSYTLTIFDATTGATVLQVPGAQLPAWSR